MLHRPCFYHEQRANIRVWIVTITEPSQLRFRWTFVRCRVAKVTLIRHYRSYWNPNWLIHWSVLFRNEPEFMLGFCTFHPSRLLGASTSHLMQSLEFMTSMLSFRNHCACLRMWKGLLLGPPLPSARHLAPSHQMLAEHLQNSSMTKDLGKSCQIESMWKKHFLSMNYCSVKELL